MIYNNLTVLGFAILFPLLFNLVFTPLLLKLAHHKEWYDDVDHRKIHTGDIPRIGGVGIFIAAAVTILLTLGLAGRTAGLQALEPASMSSCVVLLIGLIIIHAVGLLDDFANLRPLYKLYGQLLATLIVVLAGYHFRTLYLPFVDVVIPLGFGGPVLTFLWILGVTNAINLIDGLDGLSGTIATVAAFFLGLGAAAVGSLLPAIFAFALFGALVSFLAFNLPPAKLFMGDSGSLFLGYFLSTLPLFAFQGETGGKALPFAMSLVLIPIMDTIGAILRRKRKSIPFHAPDKEHLHHKLLNIGWSNRTILVIVAAVTIALGTPAYLWLLTDHILWSYILSVLWVALIVSFYILHHAHHNNTES